MRSATVAITFIGILFFAACGNTSRNIAPKDGDAPIGGDEIATDGDNLLTDEPTGDEITSPDENDEGVPKDDAVFVENDIFVGDDGAIVPDKDTAVTPDETQPDEATSDDTDTDSTLPDETLPDNDTFVGFCGDGITSGAEACDDGENNGTYAHCQSDCSGIGPHCGDGKVDTPYEECDKSNDQFCLGKAGGGGCSGNLYRIRQCNDATCKWGAWSNCGYSDGQNADNFGNCPAGYEC